MTCYRIIINFFYDYIFYSNHKCFVCGEILYETGNCECWYSDWNN